MTIRRALRVLSSTVVLLTSSQGWAQSSPDEAAKVIDLRTLAVAPGAEPTRSQTLANLSYRAKGNAKALYEFHRDQLAKAGWKELPMPYVTDQSASAVYQKAGYLVSLSTSAFTENEPADVTLRNHGNVALSKLPRPAGAKPLFENELSVMLISDKSPEAAAKEVKDLLAGKGWETYGDAGGIQYFFKQKGALLNVMVNPAPAQDNKTSVMYSAEQMSVDLPAPREATRIQYADITTTLSVDTPQSEEEMLKFYREKLAAMGWKATTENPIKDNFESFLIFRNGAQDLLELKSRKVDDFQRADVKYRTKAQVDEEERLFKEAQAKKEAEKAKGKKQ
jgi:hypothetical protein